MMRKVDSNSPLPVRSQVRAILIKEIQEGVYPRNQRIPSERDLAERYGASRASVREAIMEMISAGILFRSAGRGTFVGNSRAESAQTQTGMRQVGFWINTEIFHFVEAGYTRIMTGVEEVCRSEGFTLNFYSLNEVAEAFDELLQENAQRPLPDGHVVAGGLRSASLERLQASGKPMVMVDAMMRRKVGGIDCVRIDYATGTRDAVRHLAELGHRDIGFIGFPDSEKYEAYWRTLEELGLPYSPRLVQFLALPDLAPSMVVGFQSMNALLAGPKRPTAVLVVNDYIALGALEALSIANIAVPDDISIVGFDDLGQGAIPLTTVRCDLVDAGRIAARCLMERIADRDKPPREVIVPVTLIVRRSTAPLRPTAGAALV